MDNARVVVVGGGVSGLSSAWWLARAGVDVALVEKGIVGWEASGRNGGAVTDRSDEPEAFPLALEATRIWPTLEEELGYPTEFVPGMIRVALDEGTMTATLQAQKRYEKLGIETEILDGQTIREMLPIISPRVLGGVFSPKAGHANPQMTSQAFAWAIQDLGGRIYQHTTVTGFEVVGDRVTAVETSRGTIPTEFVISAAGPQTGLITDMVGAFVPVAPARVEIIVTSPLPPMFSGGVIGHGLYGRQTKRGNLAYGGGPHEWIDVDLTSPNKPVTPLIRNIARRVEELLPGAAGVPVIRSWAGVVEKTPDSLPIIDFLPDPKNFIVVTMSANGFGTSPGTGKAVSELVLHGMSSIDISALNFGRFADVPRTWREERRWERGQYNTKDPGPQAESVCRRIP